MSTIAQYEPETATKFPIPDDVPVEVISSVLRNKIVCKHSRVDEENIRIVATHASRKVTNSYQLEPTLSARLDKGPAWKCTYCQKLKKIIGDYEQSKQSQRRPRVALAMDYLSR